MTSRLRVACWVTPAIAMLGVLPACGDLSHPQDVAPAGNHRESLDAVEVPATSNAASDAHIGHTAAASGAEAAARKEASAHAYLFACKEDSDCIAVPKAGLCRNGVKEAINRHHADAYRHTFSKMRRGACTFLLIRDRRVATCDKQAGRCVLVVQHREPRLPAVFTPDTPSE